MRVLRVSGPGPESEADLKGHGLLPDDTVGTAARKLSAVSGGQAVHMWCYRPLTPHEAFGLTSIAGGGGHVFEAPEGGVGPRAAARPLRLRAGAQPLARLEELTRMSGRLYERVPLVSRGAVPGGYYSAHGADPWADAGRGQGEPETQAINYTGLTLYCFGLRSAGAALYFCSRSDVAGSLGEPAADRYARLPVGDDNDQTVARWSAGDNDALMRHAEDGRQAAGGSGVSGLAVTFLRVTGGAPWGAPVSGQQWSRELLEHFASAHTTPDVPVMRMGHSSVSGPVFKSHRSVGRDAAAAAAPASRAPATGDYLMFVLRSGDHLATLTVGSAGSYSLTASFREIDGVTPDGAVEMFGAAATRTLAAVSPFLPPVDASCLEASSSTYQKPRYTSRPRAVMDIVAEVPAPPPPRGAGRKGAADWDEAYTARLAGPMAAFMARCRAGWHPSWPCLWGINAVGRTAYLNIVRSPGIGIADLIRAIVRYASASSGGSLAMAGLARDLGLSVAEVAAIAESRADYSTVVPTVSVTLVSKTRVRLVMRHVRDRGTPERAYCAVAAAMSRAASAALAAEADSGELPTVSQFFSRESMAVSVARAVAEADEGVDEFMSIIDDAAHPPVDLSGEGRGAEGRGAEGRGAEGRGGEGRGADTGQADDVLRRLKRRDPELFAHNGTEGGVGPYSVKCQKGKQPLPLTDSELEAALEGSTDGAMGAAVRYGSSEASAQNYVCPEKWCVQSGVARRRGEDCPVPGERTWAFSESSREIGFLSGVNHPSGLCMPCCYKKRPVEGTVMHMRADACLGSLVQGEPGGDVRTKPRRPRHINRADRVLELGDLGEVPEPVASLLNGPGPGGGGRPRAAQAGGGGGQGPRVVRIGLGSQQRGEAEAVAHTADRLRPPGAGGGPQAPFPQAPFPQARPQALSQAAQPPGRRPSAPLRRLMADLAASVGPSHFLMTSAPRAFLSLARENRPGAEADALWGRDAGRFLDEQAGGPGCLVRSAPGAVAEARARLLAAAYAQYLSSLREAAAGSPEAAEAVEPTVVEAVNAGALAWHPPVLHLVVAPNGGLTARHTAACARGDFCAVLTHGPAASPVAEPLALLAGRSDARPRLGAEERERLAPVFAALGRVVPPEAPGSVRMVGFGMLAVGSLSGDGCFTPFQAHVLVDRSAPHAYIDGWSQQSPMRGARPPTRAEAEAAAAATGAVDFYPPSNAWLRAATGAAEDDEKDAALFGAGGQGSAAERLELAVGWVRRRERAAAAVSAAVSRAARAAGGDHLLERSPAGSGARRVADAEAIEATLSRYRGDIRRDAPGVSDDDARYAISHMIRPAPGSVVPSVSVAPYETLHV